MFRSWALAFISMTMFASAGTASAGTGDEASIAELPRSEVPLPATWDLVATPTPEPVHVAFPQGATQGPEEWWVADLSFEVTSVSQGDLGELRIDCGTNDSSAFLIIFERTEGGLETRLHDLIDGERSIPLEGGTYSFRYRNYLRNQGVAAGPATFSCFAEGLPKTDRLPAIGVTSVVLKPDSRIYATKSTPAPVRIVAKAAPDKGDRVRISYEVSSEDERSIGKVNVTLIPSDSAVKVVGEQAQSLSDVKHRATGEFIVKIEDGAPHRLGIGAATVFNSPVANLVVTKSKNTATSGVSLMASLGGVVIVALGLRSLRRTRGRTLG